MCFSAQLVRLNQKLFKDLSSLLAWYGLPAQALFILFSRPFEALLVLVHARGEGGGDAYGGCLSLLVSQRVNLPEMYL